MIDTKICSRRQAIGAAAIGWFALAGQDPKPTLRARTIVFVRHAEKRADDPEDPELTERGRRRAERLAAMFEAAGVRSTFSTGFRRTQQTVAPLASKAGLKVQAYEARDSRQFAAGLGSASAKSGDVVVVAGHSNTVPMMVEALGGKLSGLNDMGFFDEEEYERVVIVGLCGSPGERMQAVSTIDLRLKI